MTFAKISADVRALVGEFITTEGRIFDNMILLAVIDDLHAAIHKVNRTLRAYLC